MNSSPTTHKRPIKTHSRALSLVLAGISMAYAVVCAAAWAWQDHLVFHPSPGVAKDPSARGLAFSDVGLTTADGVALSGWYVGPPEGSDSERKILFFHGNGGNMSHRLRTLQTLHELGHAVLMIDYRGYGMSGGEPSESGLYLDAHAAWRYLVEHHDTEPRDIIVYGRSLGGAVAAQLATTVQTGGVILESTFTTLADMGRYRYPYLPVRWLLDMEFNSLERIATLDCGLLIAHSPSDEIVPFEQGQALSRAAQNLSAFVTLRGSHNRAFLDSGPAYYQRLDEFIRGID